MRKKVIGTLLATSLVLGLTACGSSDTPAGNGSSKSTDSSASSASSEVSEPAADLSNYISSEEEGKVINIWSWNTEFHDRLEKVYDQVESTSEDGTVTKLKDGTEIHWTINPNQDGVYQQKLDEALLKQADAAADDKIDIFLSETDYVTKYTDADADVAIPVEALGIDPNTDLADQYPFTKTVASDANGVQRGSTWQA